MVEVGHNDLESLVLLADQVFYRNLDVFEGDVGGAAAPYTLAVHLAGRNATKAALDEENGDAVHARAACTDSSCEVVTPDTIGNPLLLTVDNVMLAVFGELSFTCQVCNITTSIYQMSATVTALGGM